VVEHAAAGQPKQRLAGAATEPISLGGYEADKAALLGKGAFGVVYRGVDLTSGGNVAVKLIPMLPTADEEGFAALRNECVIGGACQHRNIARIYDCVYRSGDRAELDTQDGMKPCDNGTLYLVQEIADGRDMWQVWFKTEEARARQPGGMSEADAQFYFAQLLDALVYLQMCGIAHRDLKLQNLLLDSEERELKICDFGLATVGEGMLEAEGVGTQAMWAPELWLEPECDRHKLVRTQANRCCLRCILVELFSDRLLVIPGHVGLRNNALPACVGIGAVC